MRKEELLWIGLGKGVGSVPKAAQLLIFCKSIRYTIVKPRKTLDKGDPECSGFKNKDGHIGEGRQRKGRS